jgi:Tfp pilus assembly protein PilX
VQDVLFVVVVVAFFAVAVLLVIGCERILSSNSERQES